MNPGAVGQRPIINPDFMDYEVRLPDFMDYAVMLTSIIGWCFFRQAQSCLESLNMEKDYTFMGSDVGNTCINFCYHTIYH